MFAAGFVLNQPDSHQIIGMEVNGFPSAGVFVRPGVDPLPFAFDDNRRSESFRGAAHGQGLIFDRYLTANDPSLIVGTLTGGFIVRSSYIVCARETRCLISLGDLSIRPFVLSPGVESDRIERGDTRAMEVF